MYAKVQATTPKPASTQKIARQPKNHRICPPISGASIGAIDEQACISDIARAAWSLSARSRTIARQHHAAACRQALQHAQQYEMARFHGKSAADAGDDIGGEPGQD